MKDGKCYKGGAASGCGPVYCLGFIGAAIYFLQHATTFWGGVLGILKAIVWPAYLIYQTFGFFKM